MLRDQICAPVFLFTAYMFPAQSGKYTILPATVGVALTLPAVVKTHFTASRLTLDALILVSLGWLRVSARFWPATGHWMLRVPDVCAPSWMNAGIATKPAAIIASILLFDIKG